MDTIVPLLSQTPVASAVKAGEQYDALVHRIRFDGDEVVKAMDGAGSATLSIAWAATKFTHSLLRALNGEKGVIEPTLIKSPLLEKGVEFFSSNVELGVRSIFCFGLWPSQSLNLIIIDGYRHMCRVLCSPTVWTRFTHLGASHPPHRSSLRLPSRGTSRRASSLLRRMRHEAIISGQWMVDPRLPLLITVECCVAQRKVYALVDTRQR